MSEHLFWIAIVLLSTTLLLSLVWTWHATKRRQESQPSEHPAVRPVALLMADTVADELADIALNLKPITKAEPVQRSVSVDTAHMRISVQIDANRIVGVPGAVFRGYPASGTVAEWQKLGRTPLEILQESDPELLEELVNKINAALDARKVIHY